MNTGIIPPNALEAAFRNAMYELAAAAQRAADAAESFAPGSSWSNPDPENEPGGGFSNTAFSVKDTLKERARKWSPWLNKNATASEILHQTVAINAGEAPSGQGGMQG